MNRKIVRTLLLGFAIVTLGILLLWSGTGLYFKMSDAGPWPERATVQATGAFDRETNCFHGGGYDEWMAYLRGRNGAWNPLGWLLLKRFPRQMYDDAMAQVECRYIAYESDGFPISGYLIAPKHTAGKRLPVIVYNRGGNGSFGAITFAEALHSLVPYAQQGFVVVASQYRGSGDSEPEKYGFDEFGGADVRDVEKLLALVDRIPQADPDNIFMLGASRGVMMSYLVARNSDHIRAIASINGDADLESDLAFRPEMERVYIGRIPGYETRKKEALAERSVIHWAEELPRDMPILLIHGGRDERVDPENGPRLKSRLDAIGHPNRLIVYPEDNHSLHQNWNNAREEIITWFRSHTRVNATPPDAPVAAEVPISQ